MVTLLNTALRQRLRLYFDGDGTLRVAGPPAAEKTALALVDHRDRIAAWLRDGRVSLDWHDRPILQHPAGCVLCCTIRDVRDRHPRTCINCGPAWDRRRPDRCQHCGYTAHFVDDGHPVHKVCVETEMWRLLVELRSRKAAA